MTVSEDTFLLLEVVGVLFWLLLEVLLDSIFGCSLEGLVLVSWLTEFWLDNFSFLITEVILEELIAEVVVLVGKLELFTEFKRFRFKLEFFRAAYTQEKSYVEVAHKVQN